MAIEQSHYAKNIVSKNVVFKDTDSERKLFRSRLLLSAILVLILSLALLSRYYILQILQHDHFSTQSDANRIHAMAIPPAASVVPADGVIVSNLSATQTYTVRVYNSRGCFRDVTVLLDVNCDCPTEICVPVVLKKTKSRVQTP